MTFLKSLDEKVYMRSLVTEAIAEAIQVVTTHFLESLPISILHNEFLHESLK